MDVNMRLLFQKYEAVEIDFDKDEISLNTVNGEDVIGDGGQAIIKMIDVHAVKKDGIRIQKIFALKQHIKRVQDEVETSAENEEPIEAYLLRQLKDVDTIGRFYYVYIIEDHFSLLLEYYNTYENMFSHFTNNKQKGLQTTETEAKTIMSQLSDTLNILLDRRIFHGDIKPENVLYEPRWRKIKLIDFGGGIQFDDQEMSQQILNFGRFGSLLAFPPEYFGPGGKRLMAFKYEDGDIWATGLLMHFILHAKELFIDPADIYEYKTITEDDIHPMYSTYCKDFLIKLLQRPAYKRIKIRELKTHPWLTEEKKLLPKLQQQQPQVLKLNRNQELKAENQEKNKVQWYQRLLRNK